MRVEVIKSSGGYWYSTRTGEQFDVKEKHDSTYYVTVGDDVRHIHEFHCKVVEEMKVGDKVKMIRDSESDIDLTIGRYYECIDINDNGIDIIDDVGNINFLFKSQYEENITYPKTIDESFKKDTHYDNTNGSLYLIGHKLGLNSWEQDILKRVVRCRKKGQFKEDLEKTIRVIDLYIAEHDQSSIHSRRYGGSVKEENKKDNR